jgi:CRP/FNR family transcriptional regulator
MLFLGRMAAEQRLAAFLLSLSSRYQRLGFAADRFILHMTRQEIGSYLGLTLDTVSRVLSRLQREGLIGVHQREIELKDAVSLRDLVGH